MNLREFARRTRRTLSRGLGAAGVPAEYARRIQFESKFFSGPQEGNALPAIYGYWADTYLRPDLERFGHSGPEPMYAHYFARAYEASAAPRRIFLSIGAGNCDTELRMAKQLIDRGHRDFSMQCVELNRELLATAAEEAKRLGLEGHFVGVCQDFNEWHPSDTYDAILANNSLHHVVNLEGLLDSIGKSLAPTGFFVSCDTIGRNGHMRWPEALEIVHEYWRELPKEYTYNHLLRRHEPMYENWDCSSSGFEGIRAQDILPLLIEKFEFDLFVPFGNVVDPFIDRTFGPNFDVANAWDVAFIDRVHARDAAEIRRGAIKPCHIVAAMCAGRRGRNLYLEGLTPEFCVRDPGRAPIPMAPLALDFAKSQKRTATDSSETSVTGSAQTIQRTGNDKSTREVDCTGLWWCPDEPGWGLSIHQRGGDRLFAAWLSYDAKGDPIWYSVQPGRWTAPARYEGVVYLSARVVESNGPSAGSQTITKIGTVTLDFSDRDRATLSYVLDGSTGTKSIRRMAF